VARRHADGLATDDELAAARAEAAKACWEDASMVAFCTTSLAWDAAFTACRYANRAGSTFSINFRNYVTK
jgi:hypothetical protein